MKKHIIGLIIFTLIVGTSVLVVGLFSYSPNISKYSCSKNYFKSYKKKKKRKERRRHYNQSSSKQNVEASVSQAVFDKRTNQLTVSLKFSRENFNRGRVDLHFFVKDEFGTQYLKKETISVSSGNTVYANSFAWLNRLETRRNLYVISKVRHSRRNFDYQPRFDDSEATPVLLQTAE